MNKTGTVYHHLFAVALSAIFVASSANAQVPISYHSAAMLSPSERRSLDLKARQGDQEAAFRLALYYTSFANNLKRREYYLVLATKNRSYESIEALANFYAMPGGIFNLKKAVALRTQLKQQFPSRVDNIQWAEECAYDYHWRSPGGDRRKEQLFLKLAATWRAQAQ